MATSGMRIGIVGSLGIAWDDFGRLLAMDGVTCAGRADANPSHARMLVERFPISPEPIAVYDDVSSLIREASPDALIIATPDRSHYRAAMEGLQAGCHLLLATPLSTNVQEVVDIVGLARARDLKVCLAHQFRHQPPLVRVREMLAEGVIGRARLITNTYTFAEPPPGGDLLAAIGVDWIDGLLKTSAVTVENVAATQTLEPNGLEQAVLVSLRFAGGAVGSLAMIAGAAPSAFELVIVGETGRLIVSDGTLSFVDGQGVTRVETPSPTESEFATNFLEVIRGGASPLCPAAEVVDAVRVLEAIVRSAAIGQFVSLA